MAVNFYQKTTKDIGVTATQIGGYSTPANTQTIVLNLTLANKTTNACSVSLYHSNGTSNTFVINNVNVPAGDAFLVNKIVIETGQSLYANSSAAASIDAVMSIMELT